VDSYSPTPTHSTPSAPSAGNSSSRGSKRKTPMVDLIDAQFQTLMTNLKEVTEAINVGNSNIKELLTIAREHNVIFCEHVHNMCRNSFYRYTKSDIWDMLLQLNIPNDAIMEKCYEYLCSNPALVKRLFGMPPNHRLTKLMSIITRGSF